MAALAPKDSIHLVPSTSITIISDDGDERNESFLFEDDTQETVKSRQTKLKSGTLKRKTAIKINDIKEYREQKTSLDVALLNVIDEKDRIAYPEERIIAYVTEFILEGADIQCSGIYGNTPLHQSAWNGFPDLTKELLQRGADVHALNCDCQTPMEIAITKGLEIDNERTEDYSRVAALIIKEMDPTRVRKLFLASETESSKLNFREVLCQPDMQEATEAVLDALIEKVPRSRKAIKVHYSLLEANENGDIPSGSERTSNFKHIVDTDNKDILVHPAVMLLIQSKWKRFARNKLIMNFIYWVVTMAVLSTALFLAAADDQSIIYKHPLDYFRAICEGLMLLLITIEAIRDIMLLFIMRMKFFKEYKFFIFSYINIVTVLLLYVYIILHGVQHDVRWAFASLAYVLYALKGIRFLLIMRSISNYFLILVKIIKHDIFPFLVVFGMVLLAATGGLHLEQKLMLENGGENFTIFEIARDGIRMMVEGDKIIEYDKFSPIAYSAYLVLMFFVVVVLQSLLIAQMSDTFATVQLDATRILLLNQARTIINIEESTSLRRQPWMNKILSFIRVRLSVLPEEVWADPDKHLMKVKLPDSLKNAKTLSKVEKLMTTQRELVEELRDSMMSEQRRLITILKSLTGAEPE